MIHQTLFPFIILRNKDLCVDLKKKKNIVIFPKGLETKYKYINIHKIIHSISIKLLSLESFSHSDPASYPPNRLVIYFNVIGTSSYIASLSARCIFYERNSLQVKSNLLTCVLWCLLLIQHICNALMIFYVAQRSDLFFLHRTTHATFVFFRFYLSSYMVNIS